jgi:hypothetical protein
LSLATAQPALRRLWSLATGFPGAHAFNAGLAIVYTLIQTLVFSRVLSAHDFSNAIAVVAVGLYLLPVNQSVARANFVLLRERMVREDAAGGLPEAAASFHASQALLLAVSVGAPFGIGFRNGHEYILLFCQLFFCLFSNIWFSEIQMTMLATGRALRFEILALVRRGINFGLMTWLFFHRDFFWFNVLIAIQTVLFHLYLLLVTSRDTGLFAWPRGLTSAGVRAQLSRLWMSLQATFAEWLTLSAPYAIFTVRFGIGPGLITLDVVMKLLRMVVTVTRNLCEIALPRVSRAVFSGQAERARTATAIVLAGGGGAALVIGVAVLFWEHRVFSLLLGPNNTVPTGAGIPTFVGLLSAVGFAAGAHLIGHAGAARAIRRLMAVAIGASLSFAAFTFALPPDVLRDLWAFSLSLTLVSGCALFLLERLLRSRAPA